MVFETYLQSDLKQGIKVKQLTGNMFTMDNKGNKIIVEVYDNGEPVTLDQTKAITAYMIRSDNKTVIVGTAGAEEYTAYESASAVSLTLPSNAYGVEGQLSIVIKHGGVTVGACTAYVYRSSTDVWVDPEGEIPSIDELEQMLSEYAATNAAAQKVANMTVTAEAASGDTPDVIKTMVGSGSNEHVNLNFKLVRGETGPQGETGAIPVFSVGTVSDVPYGTGASVTITGTAAAPILNFNLQAGQSGNETIDDTKGIGDTDFVWSADQNDKLYGIQDGRTNELCSLVNYGYDKAFHFAPDGSTYDNIDETRNKNIVRLNGSPTGKYNSYHHLKLNNTPTRTQSTSTVDDWTEPTYFVAGHTYRITVTKLSGTCTFDGETYIPIVWAFKQGTHTEGGTEIYNDGNKVIVEFTADSSGYQIDMTRIVGRVFTNFICSVVMQDMSVESANETPTTKAPVIEQGIDSSADVQTFADGADNMPMNIEVGLSHLQNLHGYDKPWAGGNGKNLLYAKNWDETITSVTYTQDGSGMVDCSGTSSSASWYRIDRGAQSGQQPLVLPSGSYIVSATGLITNTYIRVTDSTGTERDITPSTTSQTITSDGTNAISLNMRVQSGVAFGTSTKIYCMIRSASVSDDTWEPYSNICPITGHTASKIYQTGKNLFAKDYAEWVNNKTINSEGKIIDNTSYRYSDTFFRVNGGADIVAQATVVTAVNLGTLLVEYDENKNFIQRDSFIGATGQTTGDKVVTITTNANCRYFRMITPRVAPPSNIMISYGTTASDYESNSNAYDITFPTSAGNAYSGTLAIGNDGICTLSVNYGVVDLGSLEWTDAQDYKYRVKSPTDSAARANGGIDGLCSCYKNAKGSSTADFALMDGAFFINNSTYSGTSYILIRDTTITDASQLATRLSGQYLVYPLSTPVEYYLTVPQVRTLLGFNNIWCNNAGQVINSITYPTDTKTYIDNQNADGMIAKTEASMTATKAYAEGELFTVKSKLYKATAAIAIGDAFVTGTNCTETTVADEISAILNSYATGVSF